MPLQHESRQHSSSPPAALLHQLRPAVLCDVQEACGRNACSTHSLHGTRGKHSMADMSNVYLCDNVSNRGGEYRSVHRYIIVTKALRGHNAKLFGKIKNEIEYGTAIR